MADKTETTDHAQGFLARGPEVTGSRAGVKMRLVGDVVMERADGRQKRWPDGMEIVVPLPRAVYLLRSWYWYPADKAAEVALTPYSQGVINV